MQEQLANITYAVNEKLLILNTDLRVINASPAFYKMFNVRPGDTVGRPLGELGHGQWDDPALQKRLIGLLPAGGTFDAFEVRRDFPNLGPRTMMLSARKLLNKGQETGTILLAIVDVTADHLLADERIREDTRYEFALSAVADAVIVTDAEGLITFMNPVAEKLTGWTHKDALRRPLDEVFNIVDERLRKPVEGPVPRAIREGPIVGLAGLTILLARDGVQWPLDDIATPIRDGTGKIIGVAVVFRTITNRRRSAKRLEGSEVRYRRLFETAHDGILILDAQSGRVLDVNRFMLDLLHYPTEHFLGKELWEIGVFKDIEANKAAMATLQERGSIRYEDLPLQDKNGRHIPVEFVSNVYREGNNNVIQCNVRDITERRRVEMELEKTKADAEAANRAKSEFLANMSHEIRTPMTAIMGFADMILQPDQDQAGRTECVQVILRNGTYLLELINGILDLSKIEEGQMTVESLPCELKVFLEDINAIALPRATEKGLQFEIAVACPTPRFIQTDPLRLRQILVNLIGNAIKFTAAGTIKMAICVTGSDPHRVLSVDIIDSGIGMNPEQLGRLFRPFSQADGSITRKFGGTGLGLTISRQLARLLGGDIQVVSTLGKGSTFQMRIDVGSFEGAEMLADLAVSKLPAGAPADKWIPFSLKGRILLAEDGRDNQRLLSTHLRASGAEVVIADNGQIAVDLATKDPFDLIFMDMQMPVMDGYTATAELRRRGCTTAIVALTAHAMAEDRKKCMASGCTDYLTKPVERDAFLKTASRYLRTAADATPAQTTTAPVVTGLVEPIKSSMADQPGMMAIITEFVDGLPAEVRTMTELLARSDLAPLVRILHQLRGAGGGYGFTALTEQAAIAEGSINATGDLPTIAADIQSLIRMIRRIEGYDENKPALAA